MEKHYSLGEVARLLSRKPYQVTHVLVTGKVCEPEQRIGHRRLFSTDDVLRLAHHFKVAPDWSAIEASPAATDDKSPEGLKLRPPFAVLPVGENGHEIRDDDGLVFAWTGDRGRALVLAGLLETAARG
jgi:hypothetical protein